MAWAEAVDADVGAPLHGQVAGQLDQRRFGGVVDGAYEALVGDEPGHARYEAHAAAALVLEHGAGGRRCRHEHAREVNVHHLAGIFYRVLHRWSHLLDPRSRDETVETVVLVCYGLDDIVEVLRAADIYLAILQGAAPFGDYPTLCLVPIGVWTLQSVEAVHYTPVSKCGRRRASSTSYLSLLLPQVTLPAQGQDLSRRRSRQMFYRPGQSRRTACCPLQRA